MRSDAGDSFEFFGSFWGNDNEQSGSPGFAAGKTEFKLKIRPSGEARFFNVCMGEGFVKLIGSDQSCVESDFVGPPTGNYIAVFATDFEDSFEAIYPYAGVRGHNAAVAVQVVAGSACHAVLVERGGARR